MFGLAAWFAATSPGGLPPSVELSPPTIGDREVTLAVTAASPERSLRGFRLVGLENYAELDPIESLASYASGILGFADQDGDGLLSGGDLFFVRRIVPGVFELRLEFRGLTVANTSWTIVPPTITFAPPILLESSTIIDIAIADPRLLLGHFRVVVMRDGYLLDDTASLDEFWHSVLRFQDVDGDARLSPGDRFTVSEVFPGNYVLQLWWGNPRLANVSWSVTPPQVSVARAETAPGVFWFNVTVSDPFLRLEDYTASILHYSNWRDQIDSLAIGTSRNGLMSFDDVDLDGRLSVGDRVVVTVSGSGSWELYVLWRMANVVHEYWYV